LIHKGLTVFAGVILATVGVFQFFQGLAAVIKGGFYVVAPNNIYQFSVSGWGWIHLILGIVLAVTGFFILTGQPWARVVGIVVAVLSALANFLFTRRKGHCEYFASSMAVMLRTQGIPARVVNGFAGSTYNPVSDLYMIRASDAHSWVEAFIDGPGWMTFDSVTVAVTAPGSDQS